MRMIEEIEGNCLGVFVDHVATNYLKALRAL